MAVLASICATDMSVISAPTTVSNAAWSMNMAESWIIGWTTLVSLMTVAAIHVTVMAGVTATAWDCCVAHSPFLCKKICI